MLLSTLIVMSAAAWSLGLALPILVTQEDTSRGNTPSKDARTIFEMIEKINRRIPKLLLEGDIALQISRNAQKCGGCIWPKSRSGIVNVPYVISSQFTNNQRAVFAAAMQEFATMTCVRFVSRTKEKDYLSIEPKDGCWSHVGRTGGKQTVSLSKAGCIHYGVAQHELTHSLGFYHEHTRRDRDDYIDIMWQNISPGDKSRFNTVDGNTMHLPYDYISVMHYGKFAYSNTSSRPSIVPKPDPDMPLGQRYGLSSLDVKKINTLYDCNLCRVKLPDAAGSFSSNGASLGQDGGSCLWLIQVPSAKVKLQLSAFNVPSSSDDCDDSYIKVYDGASKAENVLLGKTCGNRAIPPLISSGKTMLVEFVSSQSAPRSSFHASYVTVNYGGTFTTDNGIVTSPRYPNRYLNDMDTVWTIIAPQRYKISLIFASFDLDYSPTCSKDFLIVTDGSSKSAPVLGKYCSDETIPTLLSSGNVMLLQFHSDHFVTNPGFKASYHFVTSR